MTMNRSHTYASLCIKRSVISALRKLNRQSGYPNADTAETDITRAARQSTRKITRPYTDSL